MGSKRDLDSDVETPAAPASSSKRPRREGASSVRKHQNAYMDPTWGQKYFFLGQDATSTIPQDDDLDFEDDSDAMAYLRGVRKQATGIPHLLVAPKIGPQLPPSFQRDQQEANDASDDEDEEPERPFYGDGIGDFRGYYHDGAYTAAPDPENDYYDEYNYDEEDPSVAAAEAYIASIRSRFLALRARLHDTPPEHIVSALPNTNTPHVGPFGPRSYAFAQWTKRLETTDPLPAQVASMDKDAVLRVLRVIMGGTFLRVGREVTERTSRWVWALLARLPPAGELGHTEVGWIRDLGKRAVLLGRSLAEMAALREEIAGGGGDLGVNDGVDESEEDEEVVQEFLGEDVYSEDEGVRTEGTSQAATGDEEGREGTGNVDTDTRGGSLDKGPEDTSIEEARESEEAVGNRRTSTSSVPPEKEPKSATEEEIEDGEVEEDVPMDIDEEDARGNPGEDLEAAKDRLLARLGETGGSPEASAADEDDDGATARARMNMRATINVILTVAGEFYGQRDLLEFRDPFTGM